MLKLKFDLWIFIFAVTAGVMLNANTAQARLHPDKRSRFIPSHRSANYIVSTPRLRAQKYVYSADTNQLKKQAKKRTIAQAGRKNRMASTHAPTVRLRAKMNKKRSVASE